MREGFVLLKPRKKFPGSDRKSIYRRDSDGACVVVYRYRCTVKNGKELVQPASILVKFSVPRVSRASNSRVHEVWPAEAMRVMRSLTDQLLPASTASAAYRGRVWTVRRIDMARDAQTYGPHEMLLAYRLAKTPRVRSDVEAVGGSSLYWQRQPRRREGQPARPPSRSLGYVATMYDKARQMEARGEPGAEPRVRFEVRLCDVASRAKLTSVLKECAPGKGLAFQSRGVVRWYWLDYSRLHAFLWREVAVLEVGSRQPGPRMRARHRRRVVLTATYCGELLGGGADTVFCGARSEDHRDALRREALWLALTGLRARFTRMAWPMAL
jgi:hypothetical protein